MAPRALMAVLLATGSTAVVLRNSSGLVAPAQPQLLVAQNAQKSKGKEGLKCRLTEAAISAMETQGDFACPLEMSAKTTEAMPFFEDLHTLLVEGNGHLQGCLDNSAQEHYVKSYKKELECLYGTMLEEKCGALPSQFDKRQEGWEKICMNPEDDAFQAYELMNKEEKAYFYKLKKGATGRQVYATYLELASYKELACIYMKAVDDECVAFEKPRMLPPSYWGKPKEEE